MSEDDRSASAAQFALDAGVAAFMAAVKTAAAAYAGDAEPTIAAARAIAERARAPWRAGGPVMRRTTEVSAHVGGRDVRLRLYEPEGAAGGALVYMHGGGWTLFSLDTHDRLMREYAARSSLTVVGVDYSLSPEARFPTALEEIVGVLGWLAGEGAEMGIDPDRLAIGGDSAGANLALAACLVLRDRAASPSVRGMLLNYGAFDTDISAAAAQRWGGDAFMLGAEEMGAYWRHYLRGPADALNPLAQPLRANLAGLPPAFLAVAECDILAEQSLELARRLVAAGVEGRLELYRGVTHSFLEAVSVSAVAARALDEASAWLRARCALA